MSESRRRRWRAEEKLRIVLEGMAGGVEVSDLCRRGGDQSDDVLWMEEAVAEFGCAGVRPQGRQPERARGAAGSGVGAASRRLAGASEAWGAGCEPVELLSVEARPGVVAGWVNNTKPRGLLDRK
jgi:transposase-like protein